MISTMRVCVLILAVLATIACQTVAPLAPSEGPWRFSGTVFALDAAGTTTPLAGAALTVVHGVNTSATRTTDAAGRYAFDALESGHFTLAISAPGHVGVTPAVNLYRDTVVNFALRPE
jgi:hypothetical protein